MFLPSSYLSPLTSKGHWCKRGHSSLHTCFACAISHIQSLISSAKSVREHSSLIKSVNHNCTMVAQGPLGCLEQFLTSLYFLLLPAPHSMFLLLHFALFCLLFYTRVVCMCVNAWMGLAPLNYWNAILLFNWAEHERLDKTELSPLLHLPCT